jgi:hypothetical protein
MARFWLSIQGDDLWRAWMLLDAASIPTIAITSALNGHQPPADRSLLRLTAAVDAEREEAATTQVKTVLPDGYKVERRDDAS